VRSVSSRSHPPARDLLCALAGAAAASARLPEADLPLAPETLELLSVTSEQARELRRLYNADADVYELALAQVRAERDERAAALADSPEPNLPYWTNA